MIRVDWFRVWFFASYLVLYGLFVFAMYEVAS